MQQRRGFGAERGYRRDRSEQIVGQHHAQHFLRINAAEQIVGPDRVGLDEARPHVDAVDLGRGLRTLAKELSVPVMALAQLSRAVESREGKRPQLFDLLDSGSIEQDTDIVIFIYRDEYYHDFKAPKAPDGNSSPEEISRYQEWQDEQLKIANKASLIVAEHRHGVTGVVDVRFDH